MKPIRANSELSLLNKFLIEFDETKLCFSCERLDLPGDSAEIFSGPPGRLSGEAGKVLVRGRTSLRI